MVQTLPPGLRVKSTTVTGITRVTLGPEALLAESRDPLIGVWTPTRQIFYDEIRAVYRYRVRDWGYLVVAFLYALLGGIVLAIAGAAGQAGRSTWILSFAMLGALIVALSAYRIFVAQRGMLRLDTVTGPFQFATRQEEFVAALKARLAAATPGESHAPVPERAVGGPPAGDGADAAGPASADPADLAREPLPSTEAETLGAGPLTDASADVEAERWSWRPPEPSAPPDDAKRGGTADPGAARPA